MRSDSRVSDGVSVQMESSEFSIFIKQHADNWQQQDKTPQKQSAALVFYCLQHVIFLLCLTTEVSCGGILTLIYLKTPN